MFLTETPQILGVTATWRPGIVNPCTDVSVLSHSLLTVVNDVLRVIPRYICIYIVHYVDVLGIAIAL
jgi:hypothetical protein